MKKQITRIRDLIVFLKVLSLFIRFFNKGFTQNNIRIG